MTNLQKTAEILGLKDGEPVPELQNLVVDVKGSITGASDPMSTEDLIKIREVFLYRMENWHKPTGPQLEQVIDNCIYTMVSMGTSLIIRELDERVEFEKFAEQAYNPNLKLEVPF